MTQGSQAQPLKLGVLISGAGTNLQAIVDAIGCGELKASVEIVISNRPHAAGLERARRHAIPAEVIEHRNFPTREEFDRTLVRALRTRGVELVALAGFDRLSSPVMLEAFPNRIMNIHPALSPAFAGLHSARDALNYGVRFTGCTVFFVAGGVDDGAVIVQAVVPVMPDDDEERLMARIHAQEHRIFPYALRLYQEGRLEISGRRVIIKNPPPQREDAGLINPPLA